MEDQPGGVGINSFISLQKPLFKNVLLVRCRVRIDTVFFKLSNS
jgi:hypothetical protein